MKNKKVLWAILAIIVIAVAYIVIAKPFIPKGDGSITVKVTDLDQKLIKEKKIVFNTGDKLTDLVSKNFDNVLIKDGMLMNIESLVTPADWAQYIAIWTNGKLAEVGIETLPYGDGDVLEFRMTVNEYAGK
ncbi:MAG: hypothetical protein IJK77_07460 [Lachnospiraceae bacterium]|nr:hypothetical protein [Lachnospiraceae bacterium]